MRICSMNGCGGKYFAKGLCKKHYAHTPQQQKWMKVYRKNRYVSPEEKIRRKEYAKEYSSRPEIRKKLNEKMREYRRRPEYEEQRKRYSEKTKFRQCYTFNKQIMQIMRHKLLKTKLEERLDTLDNMRGQLSECEYIELKRMC